MNRAAPDRSLPIVRLTPRPVHGQLADPVQPEVAALVQSDEAVSYGVLPFRMAGGNIAVACLDRPSPQALRALGDQTDAVFLRTTRGEFEDAVRRSLGGRLRFGQWAVRLGKASPLEVQRALSRQRREGGRIGDLLVNMGVLAAGDADLILACQEQVPLVALDGGRQRGEDLFAAMPETFWRLEGAAPIAQVGRRLCVAASDPRAFKRVLPALERRTGKEVRLWAGGRQDVARRIEERYRPLYLRESRDALRHARPEDSAETLLTAPQAVFGVVLIAGLAAALWLRPAPALLGLSLVVQALYLALLVFKVFLVRGPTRAVVEREVTAREVADLDPRHLPTYTILVPLRDEAAVLPQLVASLGRLDYPEDRLDIKLLLEEDDIDTLRAAQAMDLPRSFEVLVLPDAAPRTKPKACNYGLLHARGEFAVIYDAEDEPAADQLKKAVAAFRTASPDVACVQAKLSYYNQQQNALTRWFTAEYAMWFDLMLPGLQAARMPIPLGGTSNHLRVSVLREVGAWDPYNVTEDADLGIRLHKAGYRTLLINSDTLEEANAEFVNWVRQRSRWVKGYLQTWLVHMRHPLALWRSLGTKGFLGFQAMILGTPLTFLLNPLLWLLTTAWFVTAAGAIRAMFPPWLYYFGMLSMLLGNFTFAYVNMIALARRGAWDLVESALTSPLYWMLMSLASWKALLQIVTRPSHWEKTRHGLWQRQAPRAGDVGLRGAAD